jgi:hypothetical protein
MPDIIRKGVTMTEAAAEAATRAPLNRVMLECFEIWHPLGTAQGPVRFVNNTEPFFATLEDTAPRDGGEIVEFIACPVEVSQPTESDTEANPTVTLQRPDVSGVLRDGLEAARGSTIPWIIIERVYASDLPNVLAFSPPRQYTLDSATYSMGGANIGASHADFANEGIPRLTFRRDDYPGLDR